MSYESLDLVDKKLSHWRNIVDEEHNEVNKLIYDYYSFIHSVLLRCPFDTSDVGMLYLIKAGEIRGIMKCRYPDKLEEIYPIEEILNFKE